MRADLPLVIAANRDEVYARAATGPQRLLESPVTVGGRDVLGGGTWMGVTATGLVVAVTNQRTVGLPAPHARSRGALVMAALQAGSVAAIEALLATTDARVYNPFNLLFGDARALRVAYARSEAAAITVEALPPGLTVLANDRIGSPEYPKTLRAEALVQPFFDEPWPALEGALERMLSDHERPPLAAVPLPAPGSRFDPAATPVGAAVCGGPAVDGHSPSLHGLAWSASPPDEVFLRELQALCIHTPSYGTRSAAVVAVSPTGVEAYRFANGSPCTTPFTDVRPLLS